MEHPSQQKLIDHSFIQQKCRRWRAVLRHAGNASQGPDDLLVRWTIDTKLSIVLQIERPNLKRIGGDLRRYR